MILVNQSEDVIVYKIAKSEAAKLAGAVNGATGVNHFLCASRQYTSRAFFLATIKRTGYVSISRASPFNCHLYFYGAMKDPARVAAMGYKVFDPESNSTASQHMRLF